LTKEALKSDLIMATWNVRTMLQARKMQEIRNEMIAYIIDITVKCRCNERQYNEMFRIGKLFLGPIPFPYLMCVKTFHLNEFRTFNIMN